MTELKELQPIHYTPDLDAFDLSQQAPCDDRLITRLVLDDYDWMAYLFETWFPTKEQGFLAVVVEYYGTTDSWMTVHQTINNTKILHQITFPTSIFVEFLKDFMMKHLNQWNDTYAFSGGEEAVKFYNDILNAQTSYKIATDDDTSSYPCTDHDCYNRGNFHASCAQCPCFTGFESILPDTETQT